MLAKLDDVEYRRNLTLVHIASETMRHRNFVEGRRGAAIRAAAHDALHIPEEPAQPRGVFQEELQNGGVGVEIKETAAEIAGVALLG